MNRQFQLRAGLSLCAVIFASSSAAAEAPSPERGKNLSATCVACHGQAGVSQNPLWPNLAGQKAEYMGKQLRDFKAGRRQDPLMSPMSATLSEKDMDDLSAYYSSLSK